MKPVLIYGAGGLGREMARHLISKQRVPAGFVDQRAASLGTVEGLRTWTLTQAKQQAGDTRPLIVIAIHNHITSVAKLRDQILAAGFEDILTAWEFCQQEKWLPAAPYWLSPHFDWRSETREISQAYHLLADDISKKVFSEMLALRQLGDYSGLSLPDRTDQYLPKGLQRHKQPVKLIDCGAYDGDTIRRFIENRYEIAAVMAFEPDPESYAKLKMYLQELNLGQAINAGTHSYKGSLNFSSLGTGASHLDRRGDISISVESIDDVCRDFEATILKMDVEGAETESLIGAQSIIERYKPTLAISVYHKPTDLWSIPLIISKFSVNYRYYLRSHGENGFDTVLYAYPV